MRSFKIEDHMPKSDSMPATPRMVTVQASQGRFAPARRACNRACPHLGDMI